MCARVQGSTCLPDHRGSGIVASASRPAQRVMSSLARLQQLCGYLRSTASTAVCYSSYLSRGTGTPPLARLVVCRTTAVQCAGRSFPQMITPMRRVRSGKRKKQRTGRGQQMRCRIMSLHTYSLLAGLTGLAFVGYEVINSVWWCTMCASTHHFPLFVCAVSIPGIVMLTTADMSGCRAATSFCGCASSHLWLHHAPCVVHRHS